MKEYIENFREWYGLILSLVFTLVILGNAGKLVGHLPKLLT